MKHYGDITALRGTAVEPVNVVIGGSPCQDLSLAGKRKGLAACTEAERVSYNLSQEADNFNVVRQLTVIDCITGDVLFQMTGKMSITADTADNQLEIIVENEDGDYSKHFVGLSDNVTYVVEDLGATDVDKYQFTINFNPAMWIPTEIGIID